MKVKIRVAVAVAALVFCVLLALLFSWSGPSSDQWVAKRSIRQIERLKPSEITRVELLVFDAAAATKPRLLKSSDPMFINKLLAALKTVEFTAERGRQLGTNDKLMIFRENGSSEFISNISFSNRAPFLGPHLRSATVGPLVREFIAQQGPAEKG